MNINLSPVPLFKFMDAFGFLILNAFTLEPQFTKYFFTQIKFTSLFVRSKFNIRQILTISYDAKRA